MIGLPDHITACLFDLDGVLTGTAALHRAAWKETFDPLLAARGLPEFTEADYNNHVDGRPRFDGVRAFLTSRGIELPDGPPDAEPSDDTVQGVGNRKNVRVQEIIAERGVNPYPGSVRYLDAAKAAGLRIGVVTSSANGQAVLEAAELTKYVEARIDGVVITERKLHGKPAPDSFLAGAEALGTAPANAAVFEDALSGVQAGKAGHFGFVVGVDRVGQADELRAHGADLVVTDLDQLLED
ncbi:HAD family hydrolase [Actinophytocola algeriensis]|uniref:Beta-phosphoglucomutase n=1 Tax=Actinophytocola algeriensis TaxID=1768010 RepID=A0A7W7QAT6_9PSEU|nr:beta-phosphoglucomutase family hydrolase [Actinophytocola algeriensis]MBB4910147.1 beta-phosphoglucomutase family hydrolase [Actinophytocola algeriensis]MBE1480865.1 beta-phosphoglucomutase family hydrolase [Actinophytocola algeriensis]